ncbi:MAG: nucleotidyl transferase AbiEii/AbiGii toxin family protein [Candidatus Magasanikbacteria bacterium]|nr:nucleotidyl transferase AbiEii/AbiGii toxin family protein [Candidatus Magasanikbacteria bacterium]
MACSKMPFFKKEGWYLAGGTALALQVGHRQSVDLDFFTHKAGFNELFAERVFFKTGHWQLTMRDEATIYGIFYGAKIRKNIHHIIKSFVYFNDAQVDPEPSIYFKVSWSTVKNFFMKEAKILSKEFGFII